MSCHMDGKSCDGESLVCHLNPEAGEQTEEGEPFPNKKCSNYVKEENAA